MKKLLTSIVLILLLISCKYEDTVSKIEYPSNKSKDKVFVKNFEYNNHEYIYIRFLEYGRGVINGMVHNPDCKYCKTN